MLHEIAVKVGLDYLRLTKVGLNALVLATTFAGFRLASAAPLNPWLCLRTLAGTALLAASAGVLNQYLERGADARMARTAHRPLPAGRIAPAHALVFGALLAAAGLALLTLTVNILSGSLAALALAFYLYLYTPLKRVNSLSTLAGAFSGAFPPVIGWTGARGRIDPPACMLFLILFLWQIPHFLAIARKYRDQYQAAGFPMAGVLDPRGYATGLRMMLYATVLLPVSLMTTIHGLTGLAYMAGALLLGLVFLGFNLVFTLRPTPAHAQNIFWASVAYLPLILLLMMLDRVAGYG